MATKSKKSGGVLVKAHTRAGRPVRSYVRGGGFSKEKRVSSMNKGSVGAYKRLTNNNQHLGAMKVISGMLGDTKMTSLLNKIAVLDKKSRDAQFDKTGGGTSEPHYVTSALRRINKMQEKRMANKYGANYYHKMYN